MQRQITINLENSVPYDKKGDVEYAKFVTLDAPTARNIADCSHLKKLFTNAALAANEHNKDAKESNSREGSVSNSSDVSGADVMELVYAFGNSDDIEKAFIASKNIFKNCGLLDGEIALTMPLIDKISADDFELMVGEYIANFTSASMLEKNQKKN